MIGVAVIGCGRWGINYMRVFHELRAAQLLTVCDSDHDRLRLVGERYPLVQRAGRIEDLLRDSRVDAVVITTPASTHSELAQRCLQSGRHVLVEKPMALSSEAAEQLIEVAERSGKVLMVAHTFLFNSGVRKTKEIIDGDDFGHVYYLHATRTNLGPIRPDVNVVWDLAPHDTSIFNYLLGSNPVWVSAVGSKVLRNSREDIAFITLGYPDNVIANIHVSWVDPNKVREIVVVGSRKRVIFDDLNTGEQVRVFEKGVAVSEKEADGFGEFRLLVRDGEIVSPKVEPSEPLKNQCMHFLHSITSGQLPLTGARNGYEVVRVLEAVGRSLESGGTAVCT